MQVDCWSSLHWLLTLCTLTVDLAPLINRGNCLSTQKWKLTVDPLYIDCWPSLHWLLTLPILTVDTLTVDPLYINCWPSLHWVLTLSTLSVDPLYIDCWSSLHWLSIPPGSTEAITFSRKSESWLLILSTSIVNPPQDQQCWLPLCWLLIFSALTVDQPPPTDFNFPIFNILMSLCNYKLSILCCVLSGIIIIVCGQPS